MTKKLVTEPAYTLSRPLSELLEWVAKCDDATTLEVFAGAESDLQGREGVLSAIAARLEELARIEESK